MDSIFKQPTSRIIIIYNITICKALKQQQYKQRTKYIMFLKIISLIGIAIFIGISQSAGIGGGTIINILLIAGLGYSAKESVIVTYIFLMGGGLASTLAGASKLTPQGKRLIDYDLMLITLPMMMTGVILGSIINHFISELVITVIFILLILNLTRTCYNKLQESKYEEISSALARLNSQTKIESAIQDPRDQKSQQRLSQILQAQKRVVPHQKVLLVAQIYIYTVFLVLCRGGNNFDSIIGLQSCGVGTWICFALHFVLSLFYSRKIAVTKMAQDEQKQRLGYKFQNPKEKMSYKKMREGILNGFVAGIFGASVAIGGGFILIPLWLREGVDKNIVSSTTAPLILFSSSVSFFISALLGQYDSFWTVLLFFCISFTGSYVIKNVILFLIKKYNFKQLVYLLLLFVMVVSLVPFIPMQYFKYIQNPALFLQFGVFC